MRAGQFLLSPPTVSDLIDCVTHGSVPVTCLSDDTDVHIPTFLTFLPETKQIVPGSETYRLSRCYSHIVGRFCNCLMVL
jgi:hypothetical protein